LANPQIMIVVTSESDKKDIEKSLKKWKKKPAEDYWFFL
jgi:hypothetical protein